MPITTRQHHRIDPCVFLPLSTHTPLHTLNYTYATTHSNTPTPPFLSTHTRARHCCPPPHSQLFCMIEARFFNNGTSRFFPIENPRRSHTQVSISTPGGMRDIHRSMAQIHACVASSKFRTRRVSIRTKECVLCVCVCVC